ncbi:RsmB/NOP family class I SAM-dependent RNA methyltransferase [candidate division WOR-3 bacterium]|nr:RsmB/NOP family class I SAM-dependent RNA methyltransferase [candidate division WOR-3 bacterium]
MSAKRREPGLPQAMLARFEEMGLDLDVFVPALLRLPSQTFRINTLKADRESVLDALSYLDPEPVEWNDLVFRVKGRQKLGNLVEHFLGLIYVQDSSSTIPVTVLEPEPGERILDMASAPGSKTTQIAAGMQNSGLLIANEVSVKRIAALTGNLDRSGVLNSVVTKQPGQAYGHIATGYFDRILLDAPCSSEGTLSRSMRTLEIWSENSIIRLANIQHALILSAYYALKPGGVLVYSTCTFAPEENEGTVTHLLERFPESIVEPLELKGIDSQPGFSEWRGEDFDPRVKNMARIFPHLHDGEGFCVAKIRKPLT